MQRRHLREGDREETETAQPPLCLFLVLLLQQPIQSPEEKQQEIAAALHAGAVSVSSSNVVASLPRIYKTEAFTSTKNTYKYIFVSVSLSLRVASLSQA